MTGDELNKQVEDLKYKLCYLVDQIHLDLLENADINKIGWVQFNNIFFNMIKRFCDDYRETVFNLLLDEYKNEEKKKFTVIKGGLNYVYKNSR